ncbi:MAG: HDIG domain-containing protein [Candidatus Aminicenantes bacterium]|nr:MAG: HDIG domain-containing protein [Candidatus Aminicenantes bacterium]
MDREKALELVKQHLEKDNLVKHCLAVEACMREFAEKFGEDVEKWGLTGLLHDLDYQYTVDDPDNHTLKTVEMLAEYNLDEDILHAIKAHNAKASLDSKMDIALYTVDPTSGFIIACALMHPSKQLENVNLKRMKKRFKEKSFAKGANREQMQECVKMGVELDDFLVTSLTALQKIAPQLGL